MIRGLSGMLIRSSVQTRLVMSRYLARVVGKHLNVNWKRQSGASELYGYSITFTGESCQLI
jgi:hypothetical protein